mmetsp:Transcript_20083/g.50139  ORF Transcript_20083/g.50139 Transcript_20083/m.50139 type:complete len:239 (-) Transcript_20083:729-1445(-)
MSRNFRTVLRPCSSPANSSNQARACPELGSLALQPQGTRGLRSRGRVPLHQCSCNCRSCEDRGLLRPGAQSTWPNPRRVRGGRCCHGGRTYDGECGVLQDAAHAHGASSPSSDSDVAPLAPGRAPRVLHQPSPAGVADHQHGVVHACATSTGDDAPRVKPERGSTRIDSHYHRLSSNGLKQGCLTVPHDPAEAGYLTARECSATQARAPRACTPLLHCCVWVASSVAQWMRCRPTESP